VDERIAIIGMALRFPAGARDPASFWKALCDGVDGIIGAPERCDLGAVYDPRRGTPGRSYVREYGALHDDPADFDAAHFGLGALEARHLDPQQRLLLEVTHDALDDAGIPADSLEGSRTGVWVGISDAEYKVLVQRRDARHLDAFAATGSLGSTACGRLSYVLGLRGPSMSVDTACSSSLVALHLAIQAIRLGEVDLAIVAGVNVLLDVSATISLCAMGALSPTARCHTFSADADGYARGEGCGVVILRAESKLDRRGEPPYAWIRASALNHDGRSAGLTAPSGPAQVDVIRLAQQRAGVGPGQIGFVETHGSATPLGDAQELNALAEVFGGARPHPLVLGAVKSNIGHLEAAAGMAGLVKTALALKERHIPANLHFDRPTPRFDWSPHRFEVPTRSMAWSGSLLAGVSSFGIGGTNAHVILEGVRP